MERSRAARGLELRVEDDLEAHYLGRCIVLLAHYNRPHPVLAHRRPSEASTTARTCDAQNSRARTRRSQGQLIRRGSLAPRPRGGQRDAPATAEHRPFIAPNKTPTSAPPRLREAAPSAAHPLLRGRRRAKAPRRRDDSAQRAAYLARAPQTCCAYSFY